MSYRVLALCGSLRAASSNAGLIKMAQRLAPADLLIEQDATLGMLPFYNADLDVPGSEPDVVAAFRARVIAADALLIATPEYNWALPGVMKNAFDWASRPLTAPPIARKPTAVVCSGGGSGAVKARAYLNEILVLFGNTMITEPAIELKKGAESVSPDGTTTDASVEQAMAGVLSNLLAVLQQG